MARLATYTSGLEADIAMAQLEAPRSRLCATARLVGILGPGFQGATAQGFTVRVPPLRSRTLVRR